MHRNVKRKHFIPKTNTIIIRKPHIPMNQIMMHRKCRKICPDRKPAVPTVTTSMRWSG